MNEEVYPDLVRIYRLVKNNFVFREDRIERWKMPPNDYNGKQRIRDDCDGFCLACRKLLRDKNIPSRLVYCEIEGLGESYGHLVVEVDGWILDNRQTGVKPNSCIIGYRWLRISGYQPGEQWREIANPNV